MMIIYSARTQQKKKTSAFTLTELAVVLSIIGGLVGVIWGVTGDVNMARHVNTVNKQLTTIVGNIRAVYAEQPGISNSTPGHSDATPATLTTALDQLQVFPLEMRTNPPVMGTLFHDLSGIPVPGAGNVQVTASGCSAAALGAPTSATSIETCFGVIFSNLTQNACVQFLNSAITAGANLQTTFVTGAGATTPLSLPTDATTTAAACTSPGTNTVEFVYLLKDNSL